MIAILLPYTSENFPVRVRGRATGAVAGCSKLGGPSGPDVECAGRSASALRGSAPRQLPNTRGPATRAVYGRETRQRDLRELESDDAVTLPPAPHAQPVRAAMYSTLAPNHESPQPAPVTRGTCGRLDQRAAGNVELPMAGRRAD